MVELALNINFCHEKESLGLIGIGSSSLADSDSGFGFGIMRPLENAGFSRTDSTAGGGRDIFCPFSKSGWLFVVAGEATFPSILSCYTDMQERAWARLREYCLLAHSGREGRVHAT